MNRKILSLLFVSLFAVHFFTVPLSVSAASDGVVISEISMGSSSSATDEFIELYNNSGSDINLSDWTIYYKSSTGKTWTKKATIVQNAVIHAHDYYLLASTRPEADTVLTSGMSQTGGVIELRSGSAVVDRVGWGTADTFEGQAASTALAGEVIFRSFDTATQQMQDTDDNFINFNISGSETLKAPPAIEVPAPDIPTSYPAISLSELFPDPATPQSDTSDEFIELYNPNSTDVDLSGWIMKDAGGASYIIKSKIIPAQGYIAISSAESSLSLNNTGDVIYLYTPDNTLADQSADYGNAKEGLTWAVVGGAWDWTTSPTPAAANSSVYIEVDSSKPAAVKTTTKKAAAVKKAATAKPKAAKLAASSKSQAAKKDTNDSPVSTAQSALANIWPWLLIALGVGTIGYGIYEYRPEIISSYHRLKNKFTSRG